MFKFFRNDQMINSTKCYKKNLDLISSENRNNKRRLKIFEIITKNVDFQEGNTFNILKNDLKISNHKFEISGRNSSYNYIIENVNIIFKFVF